MSIMLESALFMQPPQGDVNLVPIYRLFEDTDLFVLQGIVNQFMLDLQHVDEPKFYIRDIQYDNYTTVVGPPVVMHVAAIFYVVLVG